MIIHSPCRRCEDAVDSSPAPRNQLWTRPAARLGHRRGAVAAFVGIETVSYSSTISASASARPQRCEPCIFPSMELDHFRLHAGPAVRSGLARGVMRTARASTFDLGAASRWFAPSGLFGAGRRLCRRTWRRSSASSALPKNPIADMRPPGPSAPARRSCQARRGEADRDRALPWAR